MTNERRAPVQRDWSRGTIQTVPGTITWEEHEEAWTEYNRRFQQNALRGSRGNQDSEQIARRGGFSYRELTMFLGHEPLTWEPR